jgi:hypothetical protein
MRKRATCRELPLASQVDKLLSERTTDTNAPEAHCTKRAKPLSEEASKTWSNRFLWKRTTREEKLSVGLGTRVLDLPERGGPDKTTLYFIFASCLVGTQAMVIDSVTIASQKTNVTLPITLP